MMLYGNEYFEALPRNIQSLVIKCDSKIDAKSSFSATASVCDSYIIVKCLKDNALASTGILQYYITTLKFRY